MKQKGTKVTFYKIYSRIFIVMIQYFYFFFLKTKMHYVLYLLYYTRQTLDTYIYFYFLVLIQGFFCRAIPGLVRGMGIFHFLSHWTFKQKLQYFHNNQRSIKNIFVFHGCFREGAGIFPFSLLLEIRLSNININISMLIKEI